MTARRMVIELPMPLNLANSRLHWRSLARKKKEYNTQCDIRQQLGLIPPPPATPFAKTVLNVTMSVARTMDQDNSVARCKHAVDWLVTRGYLSGDDHKHLQWAGFPRQIQRLVGIQPSIMFTLTELAVLPSD